MSRTTDNLLSIMEATEEINCLREALALEVEYRGLHGTSTEIQDYFRELKYDYITKVLKKYDLYDDVHHYYNYSMQGYVQLFFDDSPRVWDRVNTNKENLEKEWGLILDDCIEQRRDSIIVSVQIPSSDLTHKK